MVGLANAKHGKCNMCQQNTALTIMTPIDTPSGRRFIGVTRCTGCDTVKCPNEACTTRTMKVNAKKCPTCGTHLMGKYA